MTLNASGPISIGGTVVGQSIELELGMSGTAMLSLNDTALRTLASVASGVITLSNSYSKSNVTYTAPTYAYGTVATDFGAGNTSLSLYRLAYSTLTGSFFSNPGGASQMQMPMTFDAPAAGTGIYAGAGGISAYAKSNDIWGIVLATGSYSSIATTLGQQIEGNGLTNPAATQGYIFGYSWLSAPSIPLFTNAINRFDLSTYARTSLVATTLKPTVTAGLVWACIGCGSSTTKGYGLGGTYGAASTAAGQGTASATAFTYASETSALITSVIYDGGTTQSTQSKTVFYNWASYTGGAAATSTGYKFTFSTETSATFAGNAAFIYLAAWGSVTSSAEGPRSPSNNVYGWLSGPNGQPTLYVSYLTFSTETTTRNISLGNLNATFPAYHWGWVGQHIHLVP